MRLLPEREPWVRIQGSLAMEFGFQGYHGIMVKAHIKDAVGYWPAHLPGEKGWSFWMLLFGRGVPLPFGPLDILDVG